MWFFNIETNMLLIHIKFQCSSSKKKRDHNIFLNLKEKLLEIRDQFGPFNSFISFFLLCFAGVIYIEICIRTGYRHYPFKHDDVFGRDFTGKYPWHFGIHDDGRFEPGLFDRVYNRSISFGEKSRLVLFGSTVSVCYHFHLATRIPVSFHALWCQTESYKLSYSIARQKGCL